MQLFITSPELAVLGAYLFVNVLFLLTLVEAAMCKDGPLSFLADIREAVVVFVVVRCFGTFIVGAVIYQEWKEDKDLGE